MFRREDPVFKSKRGGVPYNLRTLLVNAEIVNIMLYVTFTCPYYLRIVVVVAVFTFA
jgi:hypothetical protein